MRFFAPVLIGLSMLVNPVQAQRMELIERSFTGTSKEANPQNAKRDIQEQAAQKVSELAIIDLIGDSKYQKNKAVIQSKIIKNSARYIPFIKPTEVGSTAGEFKMSVLLKVSTKDLKQLLQENSLLNENEALPVVLPVITWMDRVQGRSYRWWVSSDKSYPAFLVKESRVFESALRSSFQKNNFFMIMPGQFSLGPSVPVDFQVESVLGGDDAQFFSQYFNAPALLEGYVRFSKGERPNTYRIEIRFAVVQVSNNRTIADVSRKFDTDAGSFESVVGKRLREVAETTANDLSSQVLEAWQRGALGTSIVRVTIKGKASLPLMEGIKDKVRNQLSQVKNIRERLLSSDMVTYEVETTSSIGELSDKFLNMDLGGKKLIKISEGRDEIVLKWE